MIGRSCIALFLVLGAAIAPAAASTLTCNTEIPATMVSTVSSTSGFSGQVFTFKTTQTMTSNGISVPAGTMGYGIVLAAVPASNRARNGIVVLEPRYLLLNGTELQVTGDPRDASVLTHGANPVLQGLGAVPLPGFGLAVNEAAHGTNITIGPGYKFHVVPIGDLQVRGPCVQHQ